MLDLYSNILINIYIVIFNVLSLDVFFADILTCILGSVDTSMLLWCCRISISNAISNTVLFNYSGFSLSGFLLAYSALTLKGLENCLRSGEFNAKFFGCFLNCHFSRNYSLYKFFSNLLRNYRVFFFIAILLQRVILAITLFFWGS